MIEVLSEYTPIARKDYHCDACEQLLDAGCLYENHQDKTINRDYIKFKFGFTDEEADAILKAEANGWKIKKGERYNKQNNKCDGEIYTFRTIPEIEAICWKHGFFNEY